MNQKLGLVILLLHTICLYQCLAESPWCDNPGFPEYCWRNETNLSDGIYLIIDHVSCTAHNFTVNFTYHIIDELGPTEISVRLYGRRSSEMFSNNVYTLSSPSGSMVITRQNNEEEEQSAELWLFFRKTTCRADIFFPEPVVHGKCSFVCQIPVPTTAAPTTTPSTNTTLIPSTSIETTTSISTTTVSEEERSKLWTIAIAIPLAILIIIAIGIGCYYFGGKYYKSFWIKHPSKGRNFGLYSGASETPPKSPSLTVKVLLLYASDHKKHVEVIRNFVNFLQADLGFQVFCELFQTQEYSQDPVFWMNKHKDEADKIMVVWSPEAARRWSQYGSTKTSFNDSFTPILKQIYDDIFRNIDVGRYYFGYFDYCSKDIIPPEFNEKRVSHFKLMKQFDELYFLLRGMEKYVPEGIVEVKKVKEDSYHLSEFNKYGPHLQNSIGDMIALVAENPEWHLKDSFVRKEPLYEFVNEENVLEQNVLLVRPPSPIAQVKETYIGVENCESNKEDDGSYNRIQFSVDSCGSNTTDSGTADHALRLPATDSGFYNSEILVSNLTHDKQEPTLGGSLNSELEISIDKQAQANFDSINSELQISYDDDETEVTKPIVVSNQKTALPYAYEMPGLDEPMDSAMLKSNLSSFTTECDESDPVFLNKNNYAIPPKATESASISIPPISTSPHIFNSDLSDRPGIQISPVIVANKYSCDSQKKPTENDESYLVSAELEISEPTSTTSNKTTKRIENCDAITKSNGSASASPTVSYQKTAVFSPLNSTKISYQTDKPSFASLPMHQSPTLTTTRDHCAFISDQSNCSSLIRSESDENQKFSISPTHQVKPNNPQRQIPPLQAVGNTSHVSAIPITWKNVTEPVCSSQPVTLAEIDTSSDPMSLLAQLNQSSIM